MYPSGSFTKDNRASKSLRSNCWLCDKADIQAEYSSPNDEIRVVLQFRRRYLHYGLSFESSHRGGCTCKDYDEIGKHVSGTRWKLLGT